MKSKNKKRHCTRAKGKDLTVSRAVKIATGLKEYNTQPLRRHKNWKLYRKNQYKHSDADANKDNAR